MKLDVIDDIDLETMRAHRLHGRSFEDASPDVKLRILVEEVGEIARAIQDIHSAERKRVAVAASCGTDELEAARAARDAARAHLLTEVVQVASLAVRWLEAEGDTRS